MKELAKRLNIIINADNENWQIAYKKALTQQEVPAFLTEQFIIDLHEKYKVLPNNFNVLKQAVKLVAKNADLCLLAKIIYNLLFLKKQKAEIFKDFSLPKSQKEGDIAYDLFGVFPILAHIPFSYQALKDRGVDDKVNIDTHCQLDTCICESSQPVERPFFSTDYFMCYGAFIYSKTLRVERFRFEIGKKDYGVCAFLNKKGDLKVLMNGVILHKNGNILGNLGCEEEEGSLSVKVAETEQYFEGFSVDENTNLAQKTPIKLNKNEWVKIYQDGDYVLKVHIPFSGSFDKETCEKSYEKARVLFKKCYPEYDFKVFATHTWLLAPALKSVIKEGSNIYNFRQKYLIFPSKNSGLSVFEYVFNKPVKSINDVKFDALEQKNSLQKGIVQQLKKGNFIYEFNGFIKI